MINDLKNLTPKKMDKALLELLNQDIEDLRKVARACSKLEEGLDQAINNVVNVLTEGND